jgi:hypothetical protein
MPFRIARICPQKLIVWAEVQTAALKQAGYHRSTAPVHAYDASNVVFHIIVGVGRRISEAHVQNHLSIRDEAFFARGRDR